MHLINTSNFKRQILIILSILCLVSCSTQPPIAEPFASGHLRNACLPEAAEMTEGLRKSGIQAKVLLITTQSWKHAICVYLYPVGKNKLWAWDSDWKSLNLRAYWDNPTNIATVWVRTIGQNKVVLYAEFLE